MLHLGSAVLRGGIAIAAPNRATVDGFHREAIAAADAALKPGESMTAVPAYAINVVRYYMPASRRDRAVRYDPSTQNGAVLIVSDQGRAPSDAESYRKEYPQTIARLRGVTVLRK